MEPTDFLYSELNNIAVSFPQVHIKYAYNEVIKTHIVELLPIEEYKTNSYLDDAWIPLSFTFRQKFPAEEIVFISSDSILAIENPAFELNIPSVTFDLISDFFKPFSEVSLNYTFPTCIPIGAVATASPIARILSYPKQSLSEYGPDSDTFYQAAA